MIRNLLGSKDPCQQRFETDEALVAGLSNNEEAAFECLYRRHFKEVQQFVLNNQGDEEDAKDTFQEGIIALWTNIREEKYQLSSQARLSTYLIRICKYRWFEKLKSARVRKNVPLTSFIDPSEEAEVLVQLSRTEEVRYLSLLFAQLGEKCRKLLRLFYYEKKSMAEIAAIMGYQPASVKNEKFRCMQRLRQLHADQPPE